MLHVKSHVNSLLKWPTEATKRLAWPLRDKTQMGMAQDVADDLSFFLNNWQHLHPFVYVLLLQNWVWSYNKKQRRDCLSRADCYDPSSRRHTIK